MILTEKANTNQTNTTTIINTTTAIMSEESRLKLEQRIAQKETERAAAAAPKSRSSSNYIKLRDGQSFKAIFTGNADAQMVDFTRADGTS
jgi:3-phenylpropionate/cinnamic acid dioxygenase small subunit